MVDYVIVVMIWTLKIMEECPFPKLLPFFQAQKNRKQREELEMAEE